MSAKCLFIMSLICKKKSSNIYDMSINTGSSIKKTIIDDCSDQSESSKNTVILENFETKHVSSAREMCYRCGNKPYTYIRIFDYRYLPPEYFHSPDEDMLNIMKTLNISEMETYPEY